MKKLNRKLIPAFAMLLLSAVLMSTASFAWFSANGEVSASGLSVQATAPAALWISSDGTSFGTTAKFDVEKTGMSPVTDDIASAANLAGDADAWTFHSLNAAGRAAIGNDGMINGAPLTTDTVKINETDTKVAVEDAKNFVLQTFQLRLEGANDGAGNADKVAVNAKVTISTTAEKVDTIWKALRIAIVAEDGTLSTGGYQVFAPAADSTIDGGCVLETKLEGDETLLTLAAQETVYVHAYIWFEGNDSDCKNNDSRYGVDYAISLDFFCPTIQSGNTDN